VLFGLGGMAGDNDLFLEKIRWGMDQAQVKTSESGKKFVSYNTNRLQYDQEMNGMKFTVGYEFKQGRLHRVFYGLNNASTDGAQYLDAYFTLRDHLMVKYGRPAAEKETWKKGINQKEDPSLALISGHLKYRCEWKTGDSKIMLFCGMDNGNFKTVIIYDSRPS
jgi:hypothetical protein